jgi:hypothetical protein
VFPGRSILANIPIASASELAALIVAITVSFIFFDNPLAASLATFCILSLYSSNFIAASCSSAYCHSFLPAVTIALNSNEPSPRASSI